MIIFDQNERVFYNKVIKYKLEMTVRATDILKAIQKLNSAEKHLLREVLERIHHQRNVDTINDIMNGKRKFNSKYGNI